MRTCFHAFVLLASLPSLLASGCWTEEFEQAEAPAEEALELPSQPLPLEGSPTAHGMLRVVNELGFAELDEDVGLDRQAAASILAHRAGPDESFGTVDDRYVEDLARLDSLYWLGEENLWRIQAYALLEGWAPETVPEGCEPALAEVLDECRRFVADATPGAGDGDEPDRSDSSWGCVEAIVDDETLAAEFFVKAGLPGYREPALGYHAMLCGGEVQAEVCVVGVSGLGAQLLGACSEAEG
jgi:hypothetical protein